MFTPFRSPSREREFCLKLAVVVDDNPTVLAVVSRVLKRDGFRVLRARNLDAARRICWRRKLRIDLIVSDIELPDGSGLMFSAELSLRRPDTPLVLMSGGFRPNDPNVRRHLGPGRTFLPKPFTPGALMTKVAEVMPTPPLPPLAAGAGA
jgi:CheY-like chemotaxis protein